MQILELIRRIREGSDVRGAQEALYEHVREALLNRIHRKIPHRVRSRMDAEDVLNEAFLRSIKALSFFKPTGENSYIAWVYTISRNIIRDQSARRSAGAFHFTRGEEEGGPRESRIMAPLGRPDTNILRKDLIETGLSKLREREAEVIRLHRLEGLTFEEIASSWNKTPGSVQRFFSRSWKRFQEVVNRKSN